MSAPVSEHFHRRISEPSLERARVASHSAPRASKAIAGAVSIESLENGGSVWASTSISSIHAVDSVPPLPF